MISKNALVDLRNIIASEKHAVLSLDEVKFIAESLISLYSVILSNNNQATPHETKG